MNIKKLTAYNLARPIERRLHLETIQERTKGFARRGVMVARLASIHADIAPALEAKRRADDLLDRCVRSWHEKQGYTNAPGSSGLDIHTFGHTRGSESLVPSDSFEACALAGMDKAEQVSRNIAENNLTH